MYIINVEILKCNIIIDPKFIKKINASRDLFEIIQTNFMNGNAFLKNHSVNL